jgi:hypothetical protein
MKSYSLPKPLSIITIILLLIFVFGCSNNQTVESTPAITATDMIRAPTQTVVPVPTNIPVTETPTLQAIPTQPSMVISQNDNATFVKENYPDNSILKAGETFVKTWEIKNIGSTTWNKSYSLILSPAAPGDTMGSPGQISFAQDTSPGQVASVSVSLVAPTSPGTYTVHWLLQNDRREIFKVDGSSVWAKIIVCDPNKPCPPTTATSNSSVSTGSVSASLVSFTPSGQTSTASFCMTYPDNSRNWGPAPGTVALLVDQQSFVASNGGSLETTACFEFEFPVGQATLDGAQKISVSIGSVRILGGSSNPQADCEASKTTLSQQYPGLSFTCNFSYGGYYTDLKLPAGMSANQAQQIIFDSIERAVYGPWILTIR